MDPLSIKIRYRPVRVGWCIRTGDFDALREAVRTTFTMWGGRYNPLIPIDDAELAEQLVRLFRVDVLWPASKDDEVGKFIERFPYLSSPFHPDEAFIAYGKGVRRSTLLDIYHPIRRCFDDHFKNNAVPRLKVAIYEWQTQDPLSDVLLMMFGAVPPVARTGTDYVAVLRDNLNAQTVGIQPDTVLPCGDENAVALSWFSRAYLERYHSVQNRWGWPGFYVGDATQFNDLITFWNLRATDTQLVFYDESQDVRLANARDWWLEQLRSRPKQEFEIDNAIAIWRANEDVHLPQERFGEGLLLCVPRQGTWNGLNVKAPYMQFSSGSTLGTLGTGTSGLPRVTFQLPPKPVFEETKLFAEHFVVGVDPGLGLFGNERATLHAPFIPELNQYYGEKFYFEWDAVRAEPDGLGVIRKVSNPDLSLNALNTTELIEQIVALAGIDAKQSQAGLIASRLIQHMGGLHSCRSFKIAGVRALIERYASTRSFTRSAAMQIIRTDPTTGKESFELYHDLYIEPRTIGTDLTADAVFAHLLRRSVFRAGLSFDCPSCTLDFWVGLDKVATEATCDYCGHTFNVTPFLRDRDWRYRRSGLFGRDDNQEGALPVILTLQQLATVFSSQDLLFTTALSLRPTVAKIKQCETDFIAVVTRPLDAMFDLAIGECKTRKSITRDDVQNLRTVAEAFPSDRFNVYIIFAKLIPFTSDELALIRELNEVQRQRVIMFTARELDPYFIYERTAKEFEIDATAVTFEQMAAVTQQVFLTGASRAGDQ